MCEIPGVNHVILHTCLVLFGICQFLFPMYPIE
jgi:hypothetical protein